MASPIQPDLFDPAPFKPFNITEIGLRYIDLTSNNYMPDTQSPQIYQRVAFEVIDKIEETDEAVYDLDPEVERLMDRIAETRGVDEDEYQ